jgi:uncharacterized protein
MAGPVRTRAEALQRLADYQPTLRARGVASLALFGSAGRDQIGTDSDIDILVEFDHPVGAFEFLDVKDDLEELLGRPVDLVTQAAVKPRMRDRIIEEAVRAT